MVLPPSKELSRDDFNLREAFVLARETFRGLLLINGGGAVAVLTFYGNLLAKENLALDRTTGTYLTISLVSFAIGLWCTMLGTGFGYLTQINWGAAAYPEGQRVARERLAGRFHVTAFIFTALSPLCFLVGVVAAAVGLLEAI